MSKLEQYHAGSELVALTDDKRNDYAAQLDSLKCIVRNLAYCIGSTDADGLTQAFAGVVGDLDRIQKELEAEPLLEDQEGATA